MKYRGKIMKIAMKYFRDNYENHNDISSDNYENHNEISLGEL